MRNASCVRCPLHANVTTVCVPADGPQRAKLLVVDLVSGPDDDAVGKPAQGRYGKLLRAALDNLEVEYRITTAARCRTPDNRKPLAVELESCRMYLDADLGDMPNLEVLVTLGDAKNSFDIKGQMLSLAGIPIQRPGFLGRGVVLVPLAHPSYVFQNQAYVGTWQSHWDVVRGLLHKQDDPATRIGAEILDHVEIP